MTNPVITPEIIEKRHRSRRARVTKDPVTPAEIADRCGVAPNVVRNWIQRGRLGSPDWETRGSPIYAWERVSQLEIIASKV